MGDDATSDETTFCAGARVALGYRLAGRHVRFEGAVVGRDADGRVCVVFDDGGTGCFSPGALLNPLPPHGRAVRDGRVVVVDRRVDGDSTGRDGR